MDAVVGSDSGSWTFLSNYGHVLVYIAENPEARLRDLAAQVGMTERSIIGIVRELEANGYLTHERVGRRNRYEVNLEMPLRHSLEAEHTVGELIAAVSSGSRRSGR